MIDLQMVEKCVRHMSTEELEAWNKSLHWMGQESGNDNYWEAVYRVEAEIQKRGKVMNYKALMADNVLWNSHKFVPNMPDEEREAIKSFLRFIDVDVLENLLFDINLSLEGRFRHSNYLKECRHIIENMIEEWDSTE